MKTYSLVNMTPHTINMIAEDGSIFNFPSNGVARCATKTEVVERFHLVGCGDAVFTRVKTVFGAVEGLPEKTDDVLVLGSMVVAKTAARPDVVSPGNQVRDENGQPSGCKGVSDPS